jgi:6-phosphogluconolactonase
MTRLLVVVALLLAVTCTSQAAEMFVYFGTHTSGAGKGFSLGRFDSETGVLSPPQFLVDAKAPAFFVIHPDGKHLYTCESGSPGGIAAYAIERATGGLKLLNQKPASGGDPSFISLDNNGRFVLVANYQGGNLEVYSLDADGRLDQRVGFDQHTGKSVHPQRQNHAYAHSILTDPTNRFVLCADLGVDKLFVYRFDQKTGQIAANDPPSVSVIPGAGPRHFRFHPDGKRVYLLNEMGNTVVAFDWDSAAGRLSELQTLSTLLHDWKGTSTGAELEIHPNGRYLYASNRGHDSLAVFSIDRSTGKLSLIQHMASGGKTPRNFAFDPTGRWLVCTNHGSNNAVVFKVDADTGWLSQHGGPVEVPYPFCQRFLPVIAQNPARSTTSP